MNLARILRIILVIEILFLLGNAIAITKNYQDSWILEGIEIPFVALMITYGIYIFKEKQLTWIITFALILRLALLLLPNLKYDWFQGVYLDQHRHYRFTQDIYNTGYIPVGDLYSNTPLMHLSFVITSVTTSVPLLYSYKFSPMLLWFVYPLIVYTLMKSRFAENPLVLKYALLISSIPVKPSTSYLVIGSLIGPLLVFLILSQFTDVLQRNDQRSWIIVVIYVLALAGSHSYSSAILAISFFSVYLAVVAMDKVMHRSYFPSKSPIITVTIIIVISLAWLSHIATPLFTIALRSLIFYVYRAIGIAATGPPSGLGEAVPIGFFNLPISDALRTLLVFYGGDLILMLLTAIGVVLVIRKKRIRSKPSWIFLSLIVIFLMFLLAIGLISNIGLHWFDRKLRLLLPISPIFAAVTLYFLETKIRSNKLTVFIISLVMILAPIELYTCQPLIPSASGYYEELSKDEPIIYVNQVNSIYQRCMIRHAEKHFPNGMTIALDIVTKNQILGLTNHTFSSSHKYLYWFKGERGLDYDCFLLHLPGRSGSFVEGADARSKDQILNIIYNETHNILYTNGESYILSKR